MDVFDDSIIRSNIDKCLKPVINYNPVIVSFMKLFNYNYRELVQVVMGIIITFIIHHNYPLLYHPVHDLGGQRPRAAVGLS